MKISKWLISCSLLLMLNELHGQSDVDSTAIVQTAKHFIEGWYEGNADRMENSLHPDLISRVITSFPNSRSRIEHFSSLRLVQLTRAGGGKSVQINERRMDIVILDIYQNAASVKVLAYDAMEYLHMAKWKGQWKIINILFERSNEK